MEIYQRRLPHWQPEGALMFLTWRLHGSLPRLKIALAADQSAGRRFAASDWELDLATSGPLWLADSRVAQCVADTLFIGQDRWELYESVAWVSMSNHVHILIRPATQIASITRAVKKHSARLANGIPARTGSPFWQDESYDRWVRDSAELERIIRYIEWNPVRAGFVAAPELWRWASAFPGYSTGQVGNLAHQATGF